MKRLVLLLLAGLLTASQASAQATGTVTGAVTDGSGAPVTGAAVTVGSLGSLTGANGRFTVQNVPAGTHQVRASRLGYTEATQSITVAAGQTATANFTLTASAVELEGVVAVGYGTQLRRDVTGAVGSVQQEEIQEIASANVAEKLKGRIPGLDIRTTSFRPGAEPQIRIRAARSITAGNNPLIVVDGVPIAGGLQDVNPNSVTAIEVLKDASATAVYGSRGANGVVLITTNKGRSDGSTRISYDTRYGMNSVRKAVEVFDAEGFAEFKRWAARRVNKYPCPGYTICDVGDEAIFAADELAGYRAGVNTDWEDVISRNGALMDHQLSISGGTEATRVALGASYLNEEAVTLGQGYMRRGANASIDHSTGRLRAGLSANISSSLRTNGPGDGPWGEIAALVPYGAPYNDDGTLRVQPTTDAQRWNPLADILYHENTNLRTRTFGNAFLNYEVVDGVNLQTTFGADLINTRDGEFRGANTRNFRGTNNDAALTRGENFAWISTTQATLDRLFGDIHRINATALYEIQQDRGSNSSARVSNLPYEHQRFFNLGTGGTVNSVGSGFDEFALQSVMGRVNYTLLDRYYLTLTGRQDCSSVLAPGNKCSFFPSGALKWRVSDEGFMANQGLFNELSLRASYGITGNAAIGPYQTQGGLSRTVYSFNNVGAFGYRPGSLANSDLGWESTGQLDFGVDFGVLGNRISGAVDLYQQNTYDLLLTRNLPMTSGFGSILENVGETRNRGIEVALSTVNLDNWHGLSWTSDLSWSTNKNEIVSLQGGAVDDIGSTRFIGEPINVLFNLRKIGIWQSADSLEALTYSRKPGDIRVEDQPTVCDANGQNCVPDGRIDGNDRVLLGRHTNFPLWTGSLSNRLDFASFDLSALVYARWGYTIQSGTWPGQMSGRYNQPVLDYWTPENPTNAFPSPNRDSEGAIDAVAVQFFDGSHWRVRNITLGYSVPEALTSRIGNSTSLRIYGQLQDPWVFTDFPGIDPEGAEGNVTPSYRSFILGASVGF
jgi:TonB-linked SusC/RagA family outer membrane protein